MTWMTNTGRLNYHYFTQAEKIERIMRVLSFEFMDRFETWTQEGFLVEKHLYGTTTARILHYPKYDGPIQDQQLRGNGIQIMIRLLCYFFKIVEDCLSNQ